MARNIHVVPRGSEWAVRRDGNQRATSVHATQADARVAAIRIAKKERTEVIIHGLDGRIRDRDRYGNDPLPPREPRKVLFPYRGEGNSSSKG